MSGVAQNRSLQIVRALAATSVVYFHAGTEPKFGGFGVDIFFVLSGFVMALIVANGESATAFVRNRVSRVVPLYWIFTIIVLAMAAARPDLFNSTRADWGNFFKSILFVPYFKENGELHPMLHVGWTLNYEMYFYALLAGALFACRKHYELCVAAVIAFGYVAAPRLSGTPALSAFLGNDIVFEFLFGFLAFRLYRSLSERQISPVIYGLVAAGAYVFLAVRENFGPAAYRAVVFGIPSLFLVVASACLDPIIQKNNGRITQMLVAIGNASYAIYLSHIFVVEGCRKLLFPALPYALPATLGALIIIVIAMIVGEFTYLLIDRPIHQVLKSRLAVNNRRSERKIEFERA
jgi:peptidoglycan/LPS O-acetylase OafA/YrhL